MMSHSKRTRNICTPVKRNVVQSGDFKIIIEDSDITQAPGGIPVAGLSGRQELNILIGEKQVPLPVIEDVTSQEAYRSRLISRIPDLLMPSSHRWAGEDDHFDLTRQLKLVPFRKQKVFDRCISPEQNDLVVNSRSDGKYAWPFANPLPGCITKVQNIHNLLVTITSSLDIEWRMLIAKPNVKIEEDYFGKLVYLYRGRYKSRLKSGGLGVTFDGNSVFRHTRHGITFQPHI